MKYSGLRRKMDDQLRKMWVIQMTYHHQNLKNKDVKIENRKMMTIISIHFLFDKQLEFYNVSFIGIKSIAKKKSNFLIE